MLASLTSFTRLSILATGNAVVETPLTLIVPLLNVNRLPVWLPPSLILPPVDKCLDPLPAVLAITVTFA